MPQGEEGTVYWSNDDDKTTEQQSATIPLKSVKMKPCCRAKGMKFILLN